MPHANVTEITYGNANIYPRKELVSPKSCVVNVMLITVSAITPRRRKGVIQKTYALNVTRNTVSAIRIDMARETGDCVNVDPTAILMTMLDEIGIAALREMNLTTLPMTSMTIIVPQKLSQEPQLLELQLTARKNYTIAAATITAEIHATLEQLLMSAMWIATGGYLWIQKSYEQHNLVFVSLMQKGRCGMIGRM